MNYLHNYTFTVFSFFLLVLTSCKNNKSDFGIKNNSEISIKGPNNLYVCADRHLGNQLIANRTAIGEWERYTIYFQQNNEIILRASDYSFVGVAHNDKGFLYAGYPEAEDNPFFKITPADSGGFILQDYKDIYVSLDTTNRLIANKTNRADACIFFLNEFREKKDSHFSFNQLLPLITGLILVFASLITFQYQENKKRSIFLLLLGGFCVRLFFALLTPYLNVWDEQFHALVAKNMMDHPFSPMLYKNPVLPYSETNWYVGHIWLHKQPLFLWQMALSMKIFGVNLFALRLPSIIMSTIVIFFIYRIGELSLSKTAGFFGALLFALSNFVLEISTGSIHTDHNDIAFLFYVSASIWAWLEYENSHSGKRTYFLILIGLFSGCAILVKWLTGLLVFSGWGLSILLLKERREKWVHYRNLMISLGIAVIVCLPWQIYIINAFPVLSKYEFALNTKHFFTVVEGHGGGFWWHFDNAKDIYGISIYFLLFCLGILFMSLKNVLFKVAFVTYIVFIYLFFGIAATKMIAFTFCVSFLMYLAMGVTIERFFKVIILNSEYFPKRIHNVIYISLVWIILSGFNLNIDKIRENHTMWKKDEASAFYKRISTTPILKNLEKKFSITKDYIVLNCECEDNMPIMFFNDVIAAYNFIPDYNSYLDMKRKGYKMAIFDNGKLPSYFLTDKDVKRVPHYWNR